MANESTSRQYSASELSFQNLLLASLPQQEYNRISAHLRPVTINAGQRLCETAGEASSLYFLHTGLVTHEIIDSSASNSSTPFIAAIQGREGVVCQPAYDSDSHTPAAVVAQMESRGWWIKAETVRSELEDCQDLKQQLQQNVQSIQQQMAGSRICRDQHEDEERLAYWLLSVSDRTGSDVLQLSNKLLSQMLDRPASLVSLRIKTLERFGLIECSDGQITILNHGGLINSACDCYAPLFQ